ncbi:Uncharacterised protein [Mesomycoplasma conjunctivae]|uniref:Uncharacterized protein n=1 Tax=Mesomycoplasma conjunctivae (strain ATCC 25834 / NCTC 10147 / HRC/581) TaxID=572263 RepID=C5J6T8_MESCH|nr:hypothetical protein [Mesomycoplasma conjunctivae]CAT05201.1 HYPOTHETICAL PROTEIN MCJ_004960 [Mesomycoplasma conjunctivae]VEU66412.1 Uncharacterised protein [Mesomycoplasma conjunctivae]
MELIFTDNNNKKLNFKYQKLWQEWEAQVKSQIQWQSKEEIALYDWKAQLDICRNTVQHQRDLGLQGLCLVAYINVKIQKSQKDPYYKNMPINELVFEFAFNKDGNNIINWATFFGIYHLFRDYQTEAKEKKIKYNKYELLTNWYGLTGQNMINRYLKPKANTKVVSFSKSFFVVMKYASLNMPEYKCAQILSGWINLNHNYITHSQYDKQILQLRLAVEELIQKLKQISNDFLF